MDNWIMIEDRLPDYDEYVLWICEDGNCHVEALDKDGNPWLYEGYEIDGFQVSKATHWQYLPAPPNEKSASLKPNKLSDNFYGMSDNEFLDMQKDNPKQP